MAEAAKQIVESNGKEGVQAEDTIVCFWVTAKFKTELFFCFNKSNPTVPHLFHYSWKDFKGKSTTERLHWVDSITDYTKMKFRGGGSGSITVVQRAALFWTGKWKPNFEPSKHCQITHSERKYTLTCTPQDNNLPNKNAFEVTVSESELVTPEINLKNRS